MIAMILAGGSGTRLWPYSRTMTPKQFLNLGNTQDSLFQETCKRLAPLVNPEDMWVVGARAHEFELRNQTQQMFKQMPQEHILLEPVGRNTAPAILWATLLIPEAQRQEPILILPADHLIQAPDRFIHAIERAIPLTQTSQNNSGEESSGKIVTFGIRPDRPDTGYGYIKAGNALEVGFEVEQFVEKPDLATAEGYLQSKNYTWNAGIFMATAETLLHEFRLHAPGLYQVFEEVSEEAKKTKQALNDLNIVDILYERLPSISFDYAILESSSSVAVLPVDMEWSDLGSWESIFQVSEKDENGNVLRGDVISLDTHNSLIFTNKKLVTSIGVDHLIIVETEDALLVCDLRRTQDVKKLVETLKEEDRHERQFHTKVLRPWGSYTVLAEGKSYQMKLLEIDPGSRISLQLHRHRSEHWVVVNGSADVLRGEDNLILTENESVYIPKATLHRLGNSGKIPLQIIEVQQGNYLGEDDIERFDDDFGRTPE